MTMHASIGLSLLLIWQICFEETQFASIKRTFLYLKAAYGVLGTFLGSDGLLDSSPALVLLLLLLRFLYNSHFAQNFVLVNVFNIG